MINNCKNKAIMLLSVIAILAFGAYAFAWSGRYSGWHMGSGMMGGWGSGWFMMAFWILVLFGLILLIRWILLITNTEKNFSAGRSGALDILKIRYAKGEIDKGEFEAKKVDITN